MKTQNIENIKKNISTAVRKIGNKKRFFLHEPHLDKIDIKYLEKCIKSGFVSTAGNLIGKFENKIKNYTKSKNVIATINHP